MGMGRIKPKFDVHIELSNSGQKSMENMLKLTTELNRLAENSESNWTENLSDRRAENSVT